MTDDSMAVMCQKMVSVLAIIRKLDEGMRNDTKWNEDEMIAHTRFSIGCIKEIVPEFFANS